ncbi:MAG TPA: peptidoglycan-binding domain-containing protein [Capillibacterium sp.]
MPRLEVLPLNDLPLGKRWLGLGDRGKDVRQLQELLTALGLYEAGITGEYDLLTREGVKALQRAYHLSVDGVAGPDTCKILTEEKLHNRILKRIKEGENLHTLAGLFGVGTQAFKDPENRRRLRRVETGRLVMLEKRELIFGVRSERTTGNLAEKPEKEDFLYHVTTEELNALAEKFCVPAGSLAVDLTTEALTPRRRKMLRRLRAKMNGELIWWLGSDSNYFPSAEEADAIIITIPVSVSETYTHDVWRREVKRILTYYPCTRLLLHFDLRGKVKAEEGVERELTPAEGRLARLNRIGAPKRLGEEGWILYRYRNQDRTGTVLVPDHLTIRGIFNQVDRLNLRGLVLTGLDDWQEVWRQEGNRYFLATPRLLVMKEKKLA